MTFQRVAASCGAGAVPAVGPDPSEPLSYAGLGHNTSPQIVRRTSVTLHLALLSDGTVHVTSSDMPYLNLTDREPRRLFRDVSGALCYEIRRRLFG